MCEHKSSHQRQSFRPYFCLHPILTSFYPAEVGVLCWWHGQVQRRNKVLLPQPSLKIPGFSTSGHAHTPKWGQWVFFTDGCGSLANCFEAKARHRQTSALGCAQRSERSKGGRWGYKELHVKSVWGEMHSKCHSILQFNVCSPVWSPLTSARDGWSTSGYELASGFTFTVAALLKPTSNISDFCKWKRRKVIRNDHESFFYDKIFNVDQGGYSE